MSEINLHSLDPILGAKLIKLSALTREINNIKEIMNTVPILKDKVVFTELETRTNLIQERIGYMITNAYELLPIIQSSEQHPMDHNNMKEINERFGILINLQNLQKEVDIEYEQLSVIKQLYLSLIAQVVDELSSTINILVKQQVKLIDA